MISKDANKDTELMRRILELAARYDDQVRTSARTRDAHAIVFVSPVCRHPQFFGRFVRPAATHRHDPRLTATPSPVKTAWSKCGVTMLLKNLLLPPQIHYSV